VHIVLALNYYPTHVEGVNTAEWIGRTMGEGWQYWWQYSM